MLLLVFVGGFEAVHSGVAVEKNLTEAVVDGVLVGANRRTGGVSCTMAGMAIVKTHLTPCVRNEVIDRIGFFWATTNRGDSLKGVQVFEVIRHWGVCLGFHLAGARLDTHWRGAVTETICIGDNDCSLRGRELDAVFPQSLGMVFHVFQMRGFVVIKCHGIIEIGGDAVGAFDGSADDLHELVRRSAIPLWHIYSL